MSYLKNKYKNCKIETEKDIIILANISNVLKNVFGSVDPAKVEKIYANRKKYLQNQDLDVYYMVLDVLSNDIRKVAYPVNGSDAIVEASVDFDLWKKLAYYIYDAVKNKKKTFEEALEYYSHYLDDKELIKFEKWLKYYKAGEHLKYSGLKDKMAIRKIADYNFGLIGPGFYPSEYKNSTKELEADESKNTYHNWKNKLNGAIRRIDKLLRIGDDYLDAATQAELSDLLHQFDQEVRKIRMQRTAADLAFRTADTFKKQGFSAGSDILFKFAQEVDAGPSAAPQPPPAAPPVAEPQSPNPPPVAAGGEGAQVPEQNVAPNKEDQAGQNTSKETLDRVLSDKALPGEYEQLAGEVDLNMAATKLEEVAARLSDRRTIRLLAEFDIMLDKLGLAAMFPELSEAQSKLIDAYSYALVRTTRMLGMLSSGRSISEISEAKKVEVGNDIAKEVNKVFEAAPIPTGKGATQPPAEQKTENINNELNNNKK
jgi:hypothetical protein